MKELKFRAAASCFWKRCKSKLIHLGKLACHGLEFCI